MNTIHELRLTEKPECGTFLVESGAGTGKTYSIAVLFCWYIVGMMEEVDRVLVVTFTEAAVSELR
ncbi:MAG: UvrD-helicase domain-containing protein, partial [Spirochaetota bacterium]